MWCCGKLKFHDADTYTDTDTDSPNTATILRLTHAIYSRGSCEDVRVGVGVVECQLNDTARPEGLKPAWPDGPRRGGVLGKAAASPLPTNRGLGERCNFPPEILGDIYWGLDLRLLRYDMFRGLALRARRSVKLEFRGTSFPRSILVTFSRECSRGCYAENGRVKFKLNEYGRTLPFLQIDRIRDEARSL